MRDFGGFTRDILFSSLCRRHLSWFINVGYVASWVVYT